jgi:hypothetical protein
VLGAAALAVLVLAGCGLGRVPSTRPAGETLRRALQAWSGFPASASPRPLVLAGPDVADPPAGFPGGAAKLAYLERAVWFPARLPRGPAAAGGFRLITARQAATAFRAGAASSPPPGTRLQVTTVRLGTRMFLTDRGMRRLPAWLFGFAGVRGRAAVLAVAPARIFTPPIRLGGRPPFVTWAALGPGARALTVKFAGAATGHGPCTAGYTVRITVSAWAVAVAVRAHPHGSGNQICAAVGYPRQVSTRLAAPLGGRVAVDAVSRTAVPVTATTPAG